MPTHLIASYRKSAAIGSAYTIHSRCYAVLNFGQALDWAVISGSYDPHRNQSGHSASCQFASTFDLDHYT